MQYVAAAVESAVDQNQNQSQRLTHTHTHCGRHPAYTETLSINICAVTHTLHCDGAD